MRTGFVTLSLALSLLSLANAEDSIDPPPIKQEISAVSSNCAEAPQKIKPSTIKTTSTQKASPASIVQICAPVFPSPSDKIAVSSENTLPLPGNIDMDIGSTPNNWGSDDEKVQSKDSFKFKIKDILEAEVNSGSQWLIGSVIAIFAILAALIIFAIKPTAAKSARSWAIWFVGVAIAAVIIFFVVHRSATSTISPNAVDKLAELYELKSRNASDESIKRLELQVDQLRRELRERDSRPAENQALPIRTEPQTSSSGAPIHTLVLGILVATIAIAVWLAQARYSIFSAWPFVARNAKNPTYPMGSVWDSLPLDAIFRLEDELSMLAMEADEIYRDLDWDHKPKIISPVDFLRALDAVRREMERAKYPGEGSRYFDTLRDFKFKENARSYDFGKVKKALGQLESVLLNRYESKEEEWCPRALAALARARREIIAVCEPVPKENTPGNANDAV